MFCYQCEQAANGGCSKIGVCGKSHETSSIQDLLVYSLRGLSQVALAGRQVGVRDRQADVHTIKMLFSTLTNVNFDADKVAGYVRETVRIREALKAKVRAAGGKADVPGEWADFSPADTLEGLVRQGEERGMKNEPIANPDLVSLAHTVLFGLKGVAAYADHAHVLGYDDDAVYDFVHEGLAAGARSDLGLEEWFDLAMRTGKTNLRAMELLDQANTETYGHPVPTEVPLGRKQGKAVLISGHDLKDLEELLKQTEGKGINVYTHGEMLPSHGYPQLKQRYPHLYGHYGTGWQNQQKEFPEFPGPILMTTNCLMKPSEQYKDRVFTRGIVGWPEVKNIPADSWDFSGVVQAAQALPGFTADQPGKTVLAGFARNTVLGVADKVIAAVKAGKIRHFFLVAGCDGAKPGRNYYTEFVEKLPQDTVVLTLACGKFRFFDKDLGTIDGIPRLLDIGQCNDAYSAIQIAVALAGAFNVSVNELPLSLILSWYEQKAVAILLTLFSLGITDIRLGPSLPAFATQNVLSVLVDKFKIKPITTPEQDIAAILGPSA